MSPFPQLKINDKIAIIATAKKVLETDIEPSINIIKQQGLIPVFGRNIFNVQNQFAGSDAERLEDLQWALDDNSIKAIFIGRGGYGTTRIIEQLNWSKFKANPKWIIGYSDITVLHILVNNYGVPSLHAPLLIDLHKSTDSQEGLFNILLNKAKAITVPISLHNKLGEATSQIVGGNLSIIYSLAGTVYDLDMRDKILFIEDIDEYLYHIDRMMMQLKLSGKLAHLKGFMVGGMTDIKDNTVPFGKSIEEIILDATKDYNYPVCFNFPSGHIQNNTPLVFYKPCTLKVTKNEVSLTYL